MGKTAETSAQAPSSPPAASASSPTSAPLPTSAASPTPAPETSDAAGAGVAEAGILPASHWEPLPQAQVLEDSDSAYSGRVNSTASITSSILQYRTHLGRRYHSEIGMAEGWTPNDDQHQESMDLHHHFSTLLLDGKMFLAPLDTEKISKVLDVGTGTGIWAMDFGDEYPHIEVIGTDISPIQPSWVPPNVRFELDDANLDWTWEDNTFDYVHVRSMLGTIADWQKFYREAFRCCKPGGWMEHQDEAAMWRAENREIPETSAMGQWEKVFDEGGRKFGRTFRVLQDNIQKKCMEEAGFVDIVVKDFKCPVGEWPRDPKQRQIGMYAQYSLLADLEGYVNYIWGAVMGWSPVEIGVYTAHIRHEIKNAGLHTYYPHRVVYGRKPE
ncbi:hypothetical protein VTI74DRAFT_7817 [Chaetomium olivicolor]